MIGGLLAALVFTLVPGSLALATACRAPREVYDRAGMHPTLVVVRLDDGRRRRLPAGRVHRRYR